MKSSVTAAFLMSQANQLESGESGLVNHPNIAIPSSKSINIYLEFNS